MEETRLLRCSFDPLSPWAICVRKLPLSKKDSARWGTFLIKPFGLVTKASGQSRGGKVGTCDIAGSYPCGRLGMVEGRGMELQRLIRSFTGEWFCVLVFTWPRSFNGCLGRFTRQRPYFLVLRIRSQRVTAYLLANDVPLRAKHMLRAICASHLASRSAQPFAAVCWHRAKIGPTSLPEHEE